MSLNVRHNKPRELLTLFSCLSTPEYVCACFVLQLYLLTILLVPTIAGGPYFEVFFRVVVLGVHIVLFWKGCDMQRRLANILTTRREERMTRSVKHKQVQLLLLLCQPSFSIIIVVLQIANTARCNVDRIAGTASNHERQQLDSQ